MKTTGSLAEHSPFCISLTPRRRRAAAAEEVTCERCGMYGLCVLAGLEEPGSQLLDRVVARRQQISRGQLLYRAGDPFRGIFAVKAGSFKTYKVMEDNREQVVDFNFAGELLGLEAMDNGRYATSVRALESGSVCVMNVEGAPLTDEQRLQFQQQLIRTMSEKILQDQALSMLIGTRSAEQRVSAFLVNLSNRLSQRGLPSVEFRLPMSRDEIGDYLGLALETVSRMFKRFQAQGLLVVRGRNTRLCDLPGLRSLAGLHAAYQ